MPHPGAPGSRPYGNMEISHPEIPTFPQGINWLEINIQERRGRRGRQVGSGSFRRLSFKYADNSVVVDPDGVIVQSWRPVKVPGHAEAVLQALKAAATQ